MDITTIIVGIIILLVCSLPFIYSYKNRKKKENELIKQVTNEFTKLQAQRSTSDLEGSICFAIDRENKHFLFARRINHQYITQHVLLKDYHHVELQKTHLYSNKNNGHGPIDKLILKFNPIHGQGGQTKTILLYDSNQQVGIDSELELATKWVDMLNKNFKQTAPSTVQKARN